MKNTLFAKDIVTIDSLSKAEIELIFAKASEMKSLVKSKGGDQRLSGKIITAAFFEPSTRTFSSFLAAAQRLGAGVIAHNGMQNTSVAKGESYEHTVKVLCHYSDCLIIRHPQPGKPKEASEYAQVPVINAGDGINEHPTQALFDTYTVVKHFGTVDKLNVALVGDLKNGRTVHSLTKSLTKFGKVNFVFVAPDQLRMPKYIKDEVSQKGSLYKEVENLSEVTSRCDVIYMTRVQKERFTDLAEYERLKDFYILDRKLASNMKKNALIMHPLPIAAGEIASELDSDPRSVYLSDQLSNGMYLRMALLDLLLRK